MSDSAETIAPPTTQPLPWQLPAWRRLQEQYQSGQLAHAYLVIGEQGIGKSQFIQAFAKFLLCSNPDEGMACGKCSNCLLGAHDGHPDLLLIEPEAGSRVIKIEQIRALAGFVARTSHAGRMKLVIINQAHNLNASAANSLLKTLEEPTNNTFLFLVSDRADSLPATLRSRCQRLLLPTPGLAEATDWLQQQGIAPAQAATLAVAAGKRPLHALALAEANGIADANELLRTLIAVTQHTMPLQAAVAVALKIGDVVTVEYLLRTSSIVIQGLLTAELEHDDLLGELLQAFVVVKDQKGLVRRLLHFNLDTEKALRQLQSGTNPNPQLLLESLLWHWSTLRSAGQTQAQMR